MKLTQNRLQMIIVEEYLKEEGILQELTDEQKKEMLDWIRGQGPRPKWATDDYGSSRRGKAVQSPVEPNVDRAADTMPFPNDGESELAPQGGNPVKTAVDSIYELVADMDPEDVAEIFQIVFEKLPGVEIQDAEPEPETLYSPGSEGRPQVGFKLEELKKLIREVLKEGEYHDMGSAGEMYDVLDPHGIGGMSDVELVDMARKDGIEKIIVLDGEGDLVNREEVVAALKDV